jgi:hypothetical protein
MQYFKSHVHYFPSSFETFINNKKCIFQYKGRSCEGPASDFLILCVSLVPVSAKLHYSQWRTNVLKSSIVHDDFFLSFQYVTILLKVCFLNFSMSIFSKVCPRGKLTEVFGTKIDCRMTSDAFERHLQLIGH